MRCPKCKATLVYDGKKEYETILEHVSDPNQTKFPLRPAYVCPNKCFGKEQFFGTYGDFYGEGHYYKIKYMHALDSLARKSDIQTAFDMPYRKRYRSYVIALKNLIIEGERDVPPRWTWGFYWLRGRFMRACYRYLYQRRKGIRKEIRTNA